MKKIFLTGVVSLLPITITLYILQQVFIFMDSIPARFLEAVFGMRIPGLGFILTLALVFLFGLLTQKVAGGAVRNMLHNLLLRVPIVSTVYGPLKQLIDSFVGERSEAFREVVLIEYPRPGIRSVAFVTSRKTGAPQRAAGQDLVNVFIPTTPNPTSGFYLLIPPEEIVPLDMSVEEGLRLIVSAGMIYPGATDASDPDHDHAQVPVD